MNNRLSEAQVSLIECLKFLKLEKNTIVAIMLLIPEDEQIAEMAEFLLENPKAIESDIIEMANRLTKL